MTVHIVFLFNGIGNQLSQYALYKNLLRDHKRVYLVDNCSVIPEYTEGLDLLKLLPSLKSELVSYWLAKVIILFVNILGQNRSKIIKRVAHLASRIFSIKIINEKNYWQEKSLINIYIDGWLNKVVSNPLGIYDPVFASYLAESIINTNQSQNEICAIHFRGGDYLDGGVSSKIYGGIADFNYYRRAIQKMQQEKSINQFVIFTNDRQRAQIIFENLDIKFIYSSDLGCINFLDDLVGMSTFKNIIISNSSYSYWSAATFASEKFVICPPKYRHSNDIDIYPEDWIKV